MSAKVGMRYWIKNSFTLYYYLANEHKDWFSYTFVSTFTNILSFDNEILSNDYMKFTKDLKLKRIKNILA